MWAFGEETCLQATRNGCTPVRANSYILGQYSYIIGQYSDIIHMLSESLHILDYKLREMSIHSAVERACMLEILRQQVHMQQKQDQLAPNRTYCWGKTPYTSPHNEFTTTISEIPDVIPSKLPPIPINSARDSHTTRPRNRWHHQLYISGEYEEQAH